MAFIKKTYTLFDEKLDQMSTKVVAAAEALAGLLAHAAEAASRAKDVAEIEHAADRIVRDTIALAPANMPPRDRNDLMRLLVELDDIVDGCHETAQRAWLHQVGESTPEATAMAAVLVDAGHAVRKIVHALREGQEAHAILELCLDLGRLENKGDEVYRSAMLALFSGQREALHVARWKDVYERLEGAINKCRDVAHLVEGLVQAIA
jgi:uncharacterized protein